MTIHTSCFRETSEVTKPCHRLAGENQRNNDLVWRCITFKVYSFVIGIQRIDLKSICVDFEANSETCQQIDRMSRKKAGKGKNGSSPTTGSPTGKPNGTAGKTNPGGVVQANGVVHPSRPSLSNSSEFYDIAFKVSVDCSTLLYPRLCKQYKIELHFITCKVSHTTITIP